MTSSRTIAAVLLAALCAATAVALHGRYVCGHLNRWHGAHFQRHVLIISSIISVRWPAV